MDRCAPSGDETLDAGDDLIGAHRACDVHGQGFSGVFIDNVQQFQPALVGGLIKLEVQRPHLIRCFGPQQDTVIAAGAAYLVLGWWRPSQAFFTPQTPQPLVVHRPSLTTDHIMGLAPPQPGMVPCEYAEPTTQFLIGGRAPVGLAAAALSGVDQPPDMPDAAKPRTVLEVPPHSGGDDPGSPFSLSQLLEHRLIQLRLS